MKKMLVLFILNFFFLFAGSVHAHTGKTYTIIMTDKEYSPRNVVILQGDTIVFENNGNKPKWPASNIHPTHDIYPEFDPQKPVKPSLSWEFTFKKAGKWRYHDHLAPDMTGTITVNADTHVKAPSNTTADSQTTTKFTFVEKVKLHASRLYYRLFPKRAPQKLKGLNIHALAKDERKITYLLSIFGPTAIMEALLQDSGGGSVLDCHQEAHKIGRISYVLFKAEAFGRGNASCHSGYYHGAMEGFLNDKGTNDLSKNITSICSTFQTSFGNFECLHGVGHGLLAYEDYDMPEALRLCRDLKDPFAFSSCYGGVFMENIVAGEGAGAKSGHTTKWLSRDPHFPCNALGQDEAVLYQCYQMQTSRMRDLFGFNVVKMAEECHKAPEDMVPVCFTSLGRDVAGNVLRDPQRIKKECGKISNENNYQDECIVGALNVIVDFWGENLQDQGSALCRLLDTSQKKNCYDTLAGRLTDVFKTQKEAGERCKYFETTYQNICRTYKLI